MPRLKSGTVAVQGLDEFRQALKKLEGDEATNALKDANFKVAEMVTRGAQGRASSAMEQSAMATLRPARQAARAQVTGGNGIDYFGGATFGAMHNQMRPSTNGNPGLGYNQFKPWTRGGYALFPYIADATDEIVEVYGDEIDKITQAVFPD